MPDDGAAPAVDVAALMAELRAEIQAARAPSPTTPPPSPDAIARRLDVLERQATVFERPFLSQVPVFGPAIAGFRETWNSVSAKWYVRPMLQQQNEFNLAVVRVLGDLTRQVAALEQRLAALEEVAGRDTAKPDQVKE
ncbi:MAG: hypothetical protein U0822_21015 [Anaerolineae bacterium]